MEQDEPERQGTTPALGCFFALIMSIPVWIAVYFVISSLTGWKL